MRLKTPRDAGVLRETIDTDEYHGDAKLPTSSGTRVSLGVCVQYENIDGCKQKIYLRKTKNWYLRCLRTPWEIWHAIPLYRTWLVFHLAPAVLTTPSSNRNSRADATSREWWSRCMAKLSRPHVVVFDLWVCVDVGSSDDPPRECVLWGQYWYNFPCPPMKQTHVHHTQKWCTI